jgi:hypothetical protein
MAKSGPKLRPVSSLKSKSGKWYRTKASPEQKKNAIKTATKYSSTPANTKKRSEDNKMRKKLKIRKGSHMNASRTKSGGWTVQPDHINKSFNGSGKRSRYSA